MDKTRTDTFSWLAPLKWIGIILGGFVALLLVIALAVPFFVDFNALRDRAVMEAEAATGLDITLDDKVDFGFMPLPKVSVHNVTARQKTDDPDHPLLTADQIDVTVGIAGLFSGKIDVPEIKINEAVLAGATPSLDIVATIGTLSQDLSKPVDVSVSVKSQGGDGALVGQVTLGDKGQAPQFAGTMDLDITYAALLSVASPVKKIAIKDAAITADAKTVTVISNAVRLDEAKGSIDITLRGLDTKALRGDIKADLDTKGWALAQGFKTVTFDGTVAQDDKTTTITPLALGLDGQKITGSVSMTGPAMAINLSAPRLDLRPLLQTLNAADSPPFMQQVLSGVTLDARLNGAALTLNDLTVKDIAGVRIGASGTTKDLAAGLSGDWRVTASGTNKFLALVAQGTKLGPAFNGPMDVRATIAQDNTNFSISDLKAQLGSAAISGDVRIATGPVSTIAGQIKTNAIDVAQWFGGTEQSQPTPKTSGLYGDLVPNDKPCDLCVFVQTGAASSRWSSAPIDVTWMNTLNLDLDLRAPQLTADPWVITNPAMRVKLAGGILTLSDVAGGVLDGRVGGDMAVKNDNGQLTVNGTIKAADINLDKLTRTLAQTDKVVDGVGALDMTLAARGASPASLLQSLSGSGTLRSGSLIVYGLNIDSLVDAVNAVEDEDWGGALSLTGSNFRNGSSRFAEANIPLNVQAGVLSWPQTSLSSTRSAIQTQGTLDFPRGMINVLNNVKINTKEGRAIDAVQITTTGSMDAPQTRFDSSALTSKIKDRAAKLINKRLPDNVKNILNPLLGIEPEPAVKPETMPAAPVAEPPQAPVLPPEGQTQTDEQTQTPESNDSTELPAAINNILGTMTGQ